jgi:hypothetical protein
MSRLNRRTNAPSKACLFQDLGLISGSFVTLMRKTANEPEIGSKSWNKHALRVENQKIQIFENCFFGF